MKNQKKTKSQTISTPTRILLWILAGLMVAGSATTLIAIIISLF